MPDERLDGRQLEREYRTEQKLKNKGKELDYTDQLLILFGMIVIGSFIFIFGLYALTADDREASKSGCEKIGGKYEIVDKTYAGNTIVNIYGCVK